MSPLSIEIFLKQIVRLFRIVVRRARDLFDRHAFVDIDERLLVGVADQQDRLGDMTNPIDRKARLIRIDQRDVVGAGDVAVIGDDEAVRQGDVTSGDGAAAGWWSGSSLRRASRETSGRRCISPRR